jgi:hypothetical protein
MFLERILQQRPNSESLLRYLHHLTSAYQRTSDLLAVLQKASVTALDIGALLDSLFCIYTEESVPLV